MSCEEGGGELMREVRWVVWREDGDEVRVGWIERLLMLMVVVVVLGGEMSVVQMAIVVVGAKMMEMSLVLDMIVKVGVLEIVVVPRGGRRRGRREGMVRCEVVLLIVSESVGVSWRRRSGDGSRRRGRDEPVGR